MIEQGAKGDKPFFVACGFRRPHLPWMVPNELLRTVSPAEKLPLPVPGRRAAARRRSEEAGRVETTHRATRCAAYFACISFMDRQLGRVLDTLDRLKLWDNTIVVMLGDNGYHLGTRGGYWGKGTPYEESCGVPLLIAAPGKAQGDGLPTRRGIRGLLSDAGGSLRPAAAPRLEGRSLRRCSTTPPRPGTTPRSPSTPATTSRRISP